MSTRTNEPLYQMSLSALSARCGEEMEHQKRKETFDDQYCLEIFRRAMMQRMDHAWETLQERFREKVRAWLHSHPYGDLVLGRDTEDNYIALTFNRFWYAVHRQPWEFTTLYAALSYLHSTLNGVIIDLVRSQRLGREVPLPDPDSPDEPASNGEISEESALWASIQELVPDAREQRLMYLLYYSGLKPRQIIEHCPQEFQDIKEIYRLNHNILDRLRRNRDRLRWLLSDEEA